MKQPPANQLDPRVKNVWRLNDALWITISAAFFAIPAIALASDSETGSIGAVLSMVVLIGYIAALIIWLAVLPPVRYARWRYELTDDYLDIAKGIIWRKRYTIPFIRVQNTDTRQGPFLRMFGLASVTVSTAAMEHSIPGLAVDSADELRDRAAELARLAREDV